MKSAPERMSEMRQVRARFGLRRVELWLPEPVIAELAKAAKSRKVPRDQQARAVIEQWAMARY